MARSRNKPVALHQLLAQTPLVCTSQHADLLRQLNTELIRFLQLEQAAFCKISTINAGRLMILCQSPAWATRLKMQRDVILANFRQKILPDLAGIDIEVSPNLLVSYQQPSATPSQNTPQITEQAASYLVSVAEQMDGELKQKLMRLAELAQSRTNSAKSSGR